jgi:YVTN family beta-propeller protein
MRKLIFIWLMALLAISLPVMAKEQVLLYQTNNKGPADESISVIDAGTRKVVQKIGKDVSAVAYQPVFSPDLKRIYVSTRGAFELRVIDRKNGALIKTVDLLGGKKPAGLPANPRGVVVTRTGEIWALSGNEEMGSDIVIIDPVSLGIVQRIPMPTINHNIFLTPDGKHIIVGGVSRMIGPPPRMHVFDVVSKKELWNIDLKGLIRTFAISTNADGSTDRIFTTVGPSPGSLSGGDTSIWHPGFVVIDFKTHKEVARVSYPNTFNSPDWLIPEVVGELYHGLEIAPNKTLLLGNSAASNSVFVYSLPDLKYAGRIALSAGAGGSKPVGAGPDWISITPDSKFAFVSNSLLGSVDVIDIGALKVVDTIKVGDHPAVNTLVVIPD